jgi:hypothetical protein
MNATLKGTVAGFFTALVIAVVVCITSAYVVQTRLGNAHRPLARTVVVTSPTVIAQDTTP